MQNKEPKIIQGENWIEGKLVNVTFVKAKDCNNNKEKYKEILAMNEMVYPTSDIYECYMKHKIGYHPDYGNDGYWQVCEKGERGASLFYYSTTDWIELVIVNG